MSNCRGPNLIIEARILLELPWICQNSALVMYNTFMKSKQAVRFKDYEVAASCLFLSSKIEERPRRLKKIRQIMLYLLSLKGLPRDQLELERLYTLEMAILEVLGFRLYYTREASSIRYLIKFVEALESHEYTRKLVLQQASKYVNDSLYFGYYEHFAAETIAASAIFIALRVKHITLPLVPHPWWNLFNVNTTDLKNCVKTILDSYSQLEEV